MLEQLRAKPGSRHDAAEVLDELEQIGQRRACLTDVHQPPATSRFLTEGGEADQAPSRWRHRARDQSAMPKEDEKVPCPGSEACAPERHELS